MVGEDAGDASIALLYVRRVQSLSSGRSRKIPFRCQQKDMKIPMQMIPKCPKCGKPLTMNLRSDGKFVEDEGWHQAAERYENFLRTRKGKILFLELGVGYNTPGIIKYPFWQMTAQNPDAKYACVNYGEAVCPDDIREKSICIDGDIGQTIEELRKAAIEENHHEGL